jgi:tight adherence protein C
MPYFIILVIFIFFTLISYFILNILIKRTDPGIKRLKDVDKLFDKSVPEEEKIKEESESKKLGAGIRKISSRISSFSKTDEKKLSGIQKALIQAGYQKHEHLQNFMSLKVFLSFISLVALIMSGVISGKSLAIIIFLGLIAGLIGYIVPNIFLSLKIQQRQEQIASGLADALDFLVICVEAGMGLNSAIVRVGKELKLKCKPLAEELLVVNREIRTGLPRENALRNLSERNRVQDLKILAGSIILSDRLGTNISDTLRAQSDSLRTRIRQRAEEQAAKAGIKLLFPLVIFILPALFLIILGPGILLFIKEILPVIQK